MTIKTRHFPVMTLLPAIALSGCAASSDKYPSLAIRDFEREVAAIEPATTPAASPAAAPAASSATLASLNQARDAANRKHAAFLNALPTARRKIAAARGSGPTSNGWADAQIALADLISRRSQTAITLGDVDLLIVEAAIAAKGSDYPRDVQREVAAILASQDRTIAQLKAGL